MKKLYTIILMICFTTISFGQSSIETDKSRIKELIIKSFDEIWSELNSKNIDKYYTKDFLLLENGEVWNNDSITNYLDNAILRKPKPIRMNTIEIIEIRVANGMAWVAYQNYATFSTDNKIIRKANWLESATAILTENGWKLEMLHSTRIKNE
ncbi:nuclear transport factor 2 family protein [Aquiflexum sp. TKW24L]|uniref:nuclear transport factor 2 family protein n=1 Tax=Aquiflexum sp. TKW24L TaxID=2942212 RepID=UPI0020BF79B8|nr:nuclear transport factor 2 family protein [Aquiflexum sp. TKW24L]MCL6260137.1 nuclear transport factor 2 family protein [Aquiflexum sp. TKW24L]